MAPADPIIIQSSSPEALRLPASSSPLLPSPSTFTRPTTAAPAPRVPLRELLGNFKYAHNDATTSLRLGRAPTGEAMTKRRRIELADASTVSVLPRKPAKTAAATTIAMAPPKAPKRAKSPKKKAQTITALATAAYQPLKEPETDQSTVSEFFALRKDDVTAATEPEKPITESEKPKKPRKPRKPRTKPTEDGTTITEAAKKPARPKKAKVKVKEANYLPPLYSPERATAQMQQQAFLFGTSSQLATDESPTFIREMQLAIRESELAPGSQAAGSPAKKGYAKVPTAPHGTCLSVEQADKELWCSAARNFQGGLHRDKSGLPGRQTLKPSVVEPTKTTTEPELQRPCPPAANGGLVEPPEKSRAYPARSDVVNFTAAPEKRDSFIHIDEVTADSKLQRPYPPPAEAGPVKPPKKSRARTTKRDAVKPTATVEKRDSFIDIDEISDSDAPATPSPPRRRATASLSPVHPLPLEITSAQPPEHAAIPLPTTGAALKPTDAQWPDIMKPLFSKITTTVKTAARSTDPAKPSWHQKILLYDPIVLEDFTAWLNERGLRIGVTRRKAKTAAKKGRKKKAAVEEAVAPEEPGFEVVEEQLQAWMVQKWCEEKSVCCLWKEGMRGGVRTRY